MEKRKVALLESTNASGKQALQVIKESEVLTAEVLTASSDYELLIEQALALRPESVVVTDENVYKSVEEKLWEADVKVYTGNLAISQVAASGNVDMVFNAMQGIEGLTPTLKALDANKMVALASNTQVVSGGKFLMDALKSGKGMLIPATPCPTALFRILQRTPPDQVKSVLITVDGNNPLAVLQNYLACQFFFGGPVEQYEIMECTRGNCLGAVMLHDGTVFYTGGSQETLTACAYALHYPGLPYTPGQSRETLFEGISLVPIHSSLERVYKLIKRISTQPQQGWVIDAACEAVSVLVSSGKLSIPGAITIIEQAIEHNTDDCSNPEVLKERYLASKSQILSSESVTTPPMK